MDISDLREKFAPILKQYFLPILLGLCGFVLLLYGLIGSVLPKKESGDVLFEAATDKAVGNEEKDSSSQKITVDIEGAVIKPGVYELAADSRVHDALIAAGGLTDRADREKVAKGLNLASKITDGGKIYIPFIGETVAVSQSGGGGGTVGAAVIGESSTGSLININSASLTELDTLSGVGPATAEKIITNRPYEKIEDLVAKKAVGQSVFEKIKDRISVY